MDELLTVKQVQDLLKVDRITVYRMLKDGRLSGIKIGHEWRFPRHEVTSFISNAPTSARAEAAGVLPLHCVQLIQNVFADVAEVGAVTPVRFPLRSRLASLDVTSPGGIVATVRLPFSELKMTDRRATGLRSQ